MWLDEALTVNIARLPLGDLRGALERDGAPPLYYVLLHVWTGVFGDSDVAARSLSGVFALGAVITCWFAARRWFDERTALAHGHRARDEPVSHPVRDRSAHVHARDPPRRAAASSWCRVRWSGRRSAGWRASRSSPRCSCTRSTGRSTSSASSGAAMLLAAWRHARTRRREYLHGRGRDRVSGCSLFVPWLPTFLSQRAHTGTPWGVAVLPGLADRR